MAAALKAEASKAGLDLELEYFFKSSMGDLRLDVSLKELPEKGVFTKDLQEDLRAGRCDCVVHSWKDLPVELPSGHQLVGTLEREDAQDVLLVKSTALSAQYSGEKPLCILSSSPRREHNLKTLLPVLLPFSGPESLRFKEIRGNIPTRVSKMLADPEAHGLILAKAALDRLMTPLDEFFDGEDEEVTSFQEQLAEDLKKCEWMVLPLRENPPAPAQGALAIEILAIETTEAGDQDFEKKLALIRATCALHAAEAERVHQERRVLSRYGGGCHQKIGAHVFAAADGKDLLCLRGETEAGEALCFEGRFAGWETSGHRDLAGSPRSTDLIWPAENPRQDSSLFERESFDLNSTSLEKMKKAEHWVLGRSNCWTKAVEDCFAGMKSPPRIWVSGARSWQSLASKGIWVSGSLESRGSTALSLSEWTQASSLSETKAVKLTHDSQSVDVGLGSTPAEPLAVYKLTPRFEKLNDASEVLPQADTKYYYWMSASQLREVLRLWPDLWEASRKIGAFHACGLGQSYRELLPLFQREKILLESHLSQEHFLKSHGVK